MTKTFAVEIVKRRGLVENTKERVPSDGKADTLITMGKTGVSNVKKHAKGIITVAKDVVNIKMTITER
jgi:hypothetical protein